MHRHQLLLASVVVSCIAAWAAAIGYTAPWDLVGEGRPGVLVALYAGSDLFWGVVLWYGIQTARGRFGSLRAAESHESSHRFSVKVATESHESSHPVLS